MNILLCTLGASWAIIPEAYGFLATEHLPLYQNHPQQQQLDSQRQHYQLQAPDEIWVCTTQGAQTQKSLESLLQWIQLCPQAPLLRIWQAGQTDQLDSQQECLDMRELIVRACLKAHDYANKGQVILSLAGGRKTMSADMQWAASLFGCNALLHVVGAEYKNMPEALQKATPELFTRALDRACSQAIMPLIMGQNQRSDLLDIRMDEAAPVQSDRFPLPLAEPNQPLNWVIENTALQQELVEREQASSRLFGNYLLDISRDERHENWRSLYRLSPRRIDQLRNTPLNETHRDWLISLPKADLHRHLGGCLDLPAQRQVAQAIWHSLNPDQQTQALQHCQALLDCLNWPWQWPEQLKNNGIRSHNSAALLIHASEQQLQHNLWYSSAPRIALKARHSFAAYERPGELTGSALLSHPAAIQPYAQAIVEQALSEGLSYIELRGSPQKYGDGLTFLTQFHQALTTALASLPTDQPPQFRFIIIADRRADSTSLEQTIQLAVTAKQQLPDFIVGLDMAGDEQQTQPEQIAHLFTPAFAHCLPITIHAGEGESADSIWQAAYHLHADRIGHGLSLNDNNPLAQRFRDRNICLELCPSSNREVVGFYDPRYPDSQNYPSYPLLELWEKGLPLTLCTDNPGISRTTLADEYLTAAAMTNYQISQWDVLAMIKQGFVHSFLSGSDKENLLKQTDAQLYQLVGAADDVGAATRPRIVRDCSRPGGRSHQAAHTT
jgi:adenosine deaminase